MVKENRPLDEKEKSRRRTFEQLSATTVCSFTQR